jgi:hypothetical protein
MGELIFFPSGAKLEQLNCYDCIHAYLGVQGVWCSIYREVISDERSAETCQCYED